MSSDTKRKLVQRNIWCMTSLRFIGNAIFFLIVVRHAVQRVHSHRRPRSSSFDSSPAISFVLSISQALSIGPLALLIFEDLIVADARQDRTPTGQFVIGCTEPVAVVTGIDSSLKHSQVCKETRTDIR